MWTTAEKPVDKTVDSCGKACAWGEVIHRKREIFHFISGLFDKFRRKFLLPQIFHLGKRLAVESVLGLDGVPFDG